MPISARPWPETRQVNITPTPSIATGVHSLRRTTTKPNPPKDRGERIPTTKRGESIINIYRFLASVIYWTRQRQGALRRYPRDVIDEVVTDFFWKIFRNFEGDLSDNETETHRHGQIKGHTPAVPGTHSQE